VAFTTNIAESNFRYTQGKGHWVLAEEAPSLTAAARDGDGNMRSGRKNARGAGRTKEWNDKGRQKWRDAPLTNKAPYKPNARIGPVRFCAAGAR
jgi:hypothetical protein